jgi:hypothetical protein
VWFTHHFDVDSSIAVWTVVTHSLRCAQSAVDDGDVVHSSSSARPDCKKSMQKSRVSERHVSAGNSVSTPEVPVCLFVCLFVCFGTVSDSRPGRGAWLTEKRVVFAAVLIVLTVAVVHHFREAVALLNDARHRRLSKVTLRGL